MKKNFTKLMSMIMTMFILLSIFSVGVTQTFAEDGGLIRDGKVVYRIISKTEKTVEIIDETSAGGDIVIPSYVQGYKVVEIDAYAFYRMGGLVSVTIPNTVTVIGRNAFYDCKDLVEVNIPNSVITIGESAFGSCEKLMDINMPDNIENLGSSVFNNTGIYNTSSNWENDILYVDGCVVDSKTSLNGVCKIEDGTKIIAYSALEGADITDLTIPGTVKVICENAFQGCSNLYSVNIQDGVETIGTSAFYNCCNLQNISIADSVRNIEQHAFYNTAYYNNSSNYKNGVLYIDNHLIKAVSSEMGSTYEIKEGTKSIAGEAFKSCYALLNIKIPESIEGIGAAAFSDCSSLKNINIPYGVENILYGTFEYCYQLESVQLPNSVKNIGNTAFSSCESLKQINLPVNLTSIGERSFGGCLSLKEIVIPNSVNKIGAFAFSSCEGLEKVKCSEGMSFILESTFDGCTGLKEVILPATIKTIEKYAFGHFNTGVCIETFYSGTADEWEQIDFVLGSDNLLNGKVHYNTTKNHYDNGTVVRELSCKADGKVVYRCPCGYEIVELTPALEHNFVNGICVNCQIPNEMTDVLIGDANDNGRLDTYDCVLIMQSAVGLKQLAPREQFAADINNDGKVTAADGRWVLQAIIGQRDLLDGVPETSAETQTELVVKSDTDTAKAGDIVTVSVELPKNADIGTLTFKIKYNTNEFEYVKDTMKTNDVYSYEQINDNKNGELLYSVFSISDTLEEKIVVEVQLKVLKANSAIEIEIIEAYNGKDENVQQSLSEKTDSIVIGCLHENTEWKTSVKTSCTNTGKEELVCGECGAVIDDRTTEAKGHKFSSWTITKEATHTSEGEKIRTCKVCGEKETEVIAKLSEEDADKNSNVDIPNTDSYEAPFTYIIFICVTLVFVVIGCAIISTKIVRKKHY